MPDVNMSIRTARLESIWYLGHIDFQELDSSHDAQKGRAPSPAFDVSNAKRG